MGIAGFYLWLKRLYPDCITDVPQPLVDAIVEGKEQPDRRHHSQRHDNLYLDMNGLIHPCCHDTQPLPEPETEEEMFERIFRQLDILVKVVRPRKCLVLCIDGVAPRSKMNQQRSRRFRAADERLESDTIAEECAHIIKNEYGLPPPRVRERWDSNLITPSTAFMERVGLAIEWFVMKKLNEDKAWVNLTVVFSDAHVPGEGEHKIMHYIRGLRAQPGYNHRTSHVIHGMDADLVCLGLSTHEEHVTILRNQLTDTFQPAHNRFCYFDLSSFRKYLERDFANIPNMNFERVLDDFVFLCFFVGNDFLPHVPLISIKTKGIELLLDHYVRDFAVHTYLTKAGEVNYGRLGVFLRNFVAKGMGSLQLEYCGVARGKQRARRNVAERIKAGEQQIELLRSAVLPDGSNAQEISDKLLSELSALRKERLRLVVDLQPLKFSYQDADYRDSYYSEKFEWDPADRPKFEANIQLCCAEYLRGMQWVMRYYTKGCPSWEWFYPFHYAPLLQDLAYFSNHVDVEMRISAPLHPVEQLLAVLPRLSVNALPEELHEAVNNPNSVLGKFYPDSVDVDFSEANFSYQGVLRIPFINCRTLHEACAELVELEEDVGTTLIFCHESNPLSQKVERLIASSAATNVAPVAADVPFTVVPITSDVASTTPVAGRIGTYENAWPRHAKLDCPDPGIASQTSFGGPIGDNAVYCYRYELNTHADYKPELLGGPRRRKSAGVLPDPTPSAGHGKRKSARKFTSHEPYGREGQRTQHKSSHKRSKKAKKRSVKSQQPISHAPHALAHAVAKARTH